MIEQTLFGKSVGKLGYLKPYMRKQATYSITTWVKLAKISSVLIFFGEIFEKSSDFN